MKAIRIHRTGGPSVLSLDEVPVPRPGRGEFLVEVRAASVNPVDTKIRSGSFGLYSPLLPATLGRDVAGIIRATGPSPGRPALRRGDAVFGMLDYNRGAYADYALASSREIVRRPRRMGEREAACAGVAALTAWQGLFDHGKLGRGQRVLIHGGAGGVGHLAVQFAHIHGAHVIATASRRDLGWVRELGADQVIDFDSEVFENVAGNIDLVLDLVGGATQERSWVVLKHRGGRIVSTVSEPSRAEGRRLRAVGKRMVVRADAAQLRRIAQLVASGRVHVAVGKVLPLRKARQAHELLEKGGVRGKVVLDVGAHAFTDPAQLIAAEGVAERIALYSAAYAGGAPPFF